MPTRRWQKFYDEHVPATLAPYPDRTLLDCLRDTVQQRPGQPFLLFKGRRLSYADVNRLSDSLATGLQADGVAILLPNSPQAIIAQIAAWKAGAIAVPVNPLYTEHELEHALCLCGARVAIVLTRFYRAVKDVQPRTPLARVIATSIKEYLPAHLRLLFTLFREKKDGHRVAL